MEKLTPAEQAESIDGKQLKAGLKNPGNAGITVDR